jgi:hypothetical protein
MTTSNPQRSVVLIGASQRVLDECVAAVRELGYTAQGTTDFLSDITSRFDVTGIDLVSLGGQVPPDRKAELREQISAINPKVIVIDSLAGIPGLIASQVREAFTAALKDPDRVPSYTRADRSIRLTLADPAAVKVTLWWRTSLIPPDPKSDSVVILDDRLGAASMRFQSPATPRPRPRRQAGHVRPRGSPPFKPAQ